MNSKTIAGFITGLCLLTASAVAGQSGKGIINTLDLDEGRISIDYNDLVVDDGVRVLTFSGATRTTDYLVELQHVSYTLNNWGRVSEIRIYDPDKLREQGFYTDDELNH
ncbi:MAG: hypothetical protein WBO06_10920 [Gammaproteobacteria bacterium]